MKKEGINMTKHIDVDLDSEANGVVQVTLSEPESGDMIHKAFSPEHYDEISNFVESEIVTWAEDMMAEEQ